MENASKALLIAGAILICIVLISVGMIIVNSTTDVTDQVGEISSSQAAQSFNTQFSRYSGSQKGSSVKSLLEAIATSNNASEHVIKVTFTAGSLSGTTDAGNIMAAMSDVTNTATYTVTIDGMNTDGYIESISIT